MTDPKLRTDAQANRDRILEVARKALAADPEVSLNIIAKTSGVGAGTLYRHFPSREALLLAVYRKEIDAQIALAPKLLAGNPPMTALRQWCDRFVRFGELKHGVADTLKAAGDKEFQEAYLPLVATIRLLMDACKKSGDIQINAKPEDVLTLLGLLLRVAPTADGKAQTKRMLDLVFRGLASH